MSWPRSDLRLSEYYGLVLARIRTDIRSRVEWALIALIVAVVGAFLLDMFSLAPKGQILLRILVAAIPAVAILAVYFGLHAIRAPWKIYNEAHAERDQEVRNILEGQRIIRQEIEKNHAETKAEFLAMKTKVDAEAARNQKPEITGEAASFRCIGHSGSDFMISCDLFLCNVRPVRTSLRRVAIDSAQLKPAFTFSQCVAEQVTLDHGIGKYIELRMMLILDDIDPRDIDGIDLTALKVYVIDAFGHQHSLIIKPGTMLFLDSA